MSDPKTTTVYLRTIITRLPMTFTIFESENIRMGVGVDSTDTHDAASFDIVPSSQTVWGIINETLVTDSPFSISPHHLSVIFGSRCIHFFHQA